MAESSSDVAQSVPNVVLASASPRRRELLAHFGVPFAVEPADLDESVLPGEEPVPYVHRLAIAKASAIGRPDALVIAADTTVDLDGEILVKPEDAADAARMLRTLSGRSHAVHTGLAVAFNGAVEAAVVTSVVTFRELSDADIAWYIAGGEPFGKAGAYAVQGVGALFVDSVQGSVTNIIGLPLATLDALVARHGFALRGSPVRGAHG